MEFRNSVRPNQYTNCPCDPLPVKVHRLWMKMQRTMFSFHSLAIQEVVDSYAVVKSELNKMTCTSVGQKKSESLQELKPWPPELRAGALSTELWAVCPLSYGRSIHWAFFIQKYRYLVGYFGSFSNKKKLRIAGFFAYLCNKRLKPSLHCVQLVMLIGLSGVQFSL